MSTLSLDQAARLAAVLCGEPVTVRFEDLGFLGALGANTRKSAGPRAILLDQRLARDPEEFSFTFFHEAGHIHRNDEGDNVMAERLADGFATMCGVQIGRTAPWRMAHSDTTEEERGRILRLASQYAASMRTAPSVPAGSVPYTRSLLEAEFRTGALDRGRQMKAGSIESMIAHSLGLASGEGGRIEIATAGGYVRVR